MSQTDNVPSIGPRKRYSVIGMQPTLLVHRFAAAAAYSGELPESASQSSMLIDPSVTGGKAVWANLTKGGLFAFTGKSLVVEALHTKLTTATWTIVDQDGNVIRATPTTLPFKLAPNERLKAAGTTSGAGGEVGVLVRIDGERIF